MLVVDDEPSVRMLVTDTLEDFGYEAFEAADGQLRVLLSDVRIDLLVTDVGLPAGMNGRQMADAARAGRPDLKVLFITGHAENAVVGNGRDAVRPLFGSNWRIPAGSPRPKVAVCGRAALEAS